MNNRGWGTTRPIKVTMEAFMDLFYKQKLPLVTIAKRLNCCITTLSSFRVNHKLPKRPPAYVTQHHMKGKHHSFYSRRKISISRTGKNTGSSNKNWKGGTYLDFYGYRMIKIATGKYAREQRFIMEKHIGRKLTHHEVVHHINGNKLDNRIENLCIHTRSSHAAEHHKLGTDFSHKGKHHKH